MLLKLQPPALPVVFETPLIVTVAPPIPFSPSVTSK
jgi:hypothetical protein